jgi:hypothetical protein
LAPGVDELKTIREIIMMSVKSLHGSRKEGATRSVKRWRMLEGIVAMVTVSIAEYDGVESTEDSAMVVCGGAGVVVGVDDEEMQ